MWIGLKISAILLQIFFIYSCVDSQNKTEPSTEVASDTGSPGQGQETQDPSFDIQLSSYFHLRNLVVADTARDLAPFELAPVKHPNDLENVCNLSGGQWHKNLYTCTCDHNKLFSPRMGCLGIKVSSKGAACLKKGMTKILEMSLNDFIDCLSNMFSKDSFLSFSAWDKASFELQIKLAKRLDNEGFSFLKGESFDDVYIDGQQKMWLETKITADGAPLRQYHKSNSILYAYPQDPLQPSNKYISPFPQEVKTTQGHCVNKISQHWKDVGLSDIQTLCSAIISVVQKIDQEEVLRFDSVYETKTCSFCAQNYADYDNHYLSYSVSFRNFHAVERVFFLNFPKFKTAIRLTATGDIHTAELEKDNSSQAQSRGFLHGSNILVMDWAIDKSKLILEEHSPLKNLWDYLAKRKIQLGPCLSPAEQEDLIGLLLVDNSIDLKGQGVESLYLNKNRLYELPSSYEQNDFLFYLLNAPLFGKENSSSIQGDRYSSLDYIKIDVYPNSHGNEMARVFTSNLDKFSLIVSLKIFNHYFFSKEHLKKFMRQHNVKIVSTVVTHFEKLTFSIQSAISDNSDIVFVFAAGNSEGEDNELDPAWSASMSNLPNVIITAMYDEFSPGKVFGNRGMIPTLAVEHHGDYGTSYSSVYVGNLAAKLRKKYPELNAAEIVSMIHDKGRKIDGLAVRSRKLVDLNIDHY